MTAPLRSAAWFDGIDEVAMSHRVALRLGLEDRGRPVIGIADTSSALNPCNDGFAQLVPFVEEGIRAAGGVPARFPVMSLGEDLMKPSAMLYRNLVSMELEETVRANPLDGVVLLANCDKSVPAALTAAASTDLPSLLLIGGARSAPEFRGRPLGSGTDLWRALDERRAGRLDDTEWAGLERCLACTGPGSCNTMGTASTMALVTEALGMCLPGATGLPAVGPDVQQMAVETGRRVTLDVMDGVRPSAHLTQAALDNAVVLLAAAGGSTNAVIHLAAVAGRLGLDADLRRMDALWARTPLLADVEPCGSRLIQHFAAAGGAATLLRALADGGAPVDLAALAGDGRSWAEVVRQAPEPVAGGVVRPAQDPVAPAPALVAVFGSLAPDGAVIKTAAASAELLEHTGRAVVFGTYDEMRARLDDDALDITADDVIVVRGCGPVGVPGMPEWGMAPIPARLVREGVRDMVRISDGRMSGTSFGTVALHVAPESAVGGPLALVADGDPIRLDVAGRRLDLLVDDAELERRRAALVVEPVTHLRGWPRLYQEHVLQAPQGCDLDFLTAPTPAARVFRDPVVGRS